MKATTKTELIKQALDDQNAKIIAALRLNPKVYDRHADNGEILAKQIGFFEQDGYTKAVLLKENGCFSLNPLEIDDKGKVSLSTFSCGTLNVLKHGSLKAAIEARNNDCVAAKAAWGDIGTIIEVVDLSNTTAA